MDGVVSEVKVVESPRRVRSHESFLRLLGLLLTLVAAVVVGVDKQTTTVPITVAKSLPPLQLPVTAKWQYMSAFVYFLVSNAVACSYAAGSLVYSMAAQSLKNNGALVLTILDLIIMGLLFSANGAVAAIGVVGRNGNSHVQWNKVCHVFDKYCDQMAAAFILSLLGSFDFLWLVVAALLNHHRKRR